MNNARERTIIGQKKFLANYEARNAFIHLIQKMTLTLHLEIQQHKLKLKWIKQTSGTYKKNCCKFKVKFWKKQSKANWQWSRPFTNLINFKHIKIKFGPFDTEEDNMDLYAHLNKVILNQ